jgi:hypothetical protein
MTWDEEPRQHEDHGRRRTLHGSEQGAHPTPVALTDAERRLLELLADLALDAWDRDRPANDPPDDLERTA